MDAGSRSAHEDQPDPHGWNTVENFLLVHEKGLENHPCIDHSKQNSLSFEQYDLEGNSYFVLYGAVFCIHDVIVEVAKYYETRVLDGRLQLRGFSYRYNAHVRNGHNLLRYDNGHADAPDEFHRHEFDPDSGLEKEKRILSRHELPVFSDVLTEIQALVESGPD